MLTITKICAATKECAELASQALPVGQIKEYYTALLGGKTIGVAGMWSNSFHPYRTYVGVVVEQNYRRKGIGKSIFLAMEADCKTGLQAAMSSGNQEAVNFCKAMGFVLARKSYLYSTSESNTTANLTTFAKLANLDKQKVLTQVFDNYVACHKHINPLGVDKQRFFANILEEMRQEDSYVRLDSKSGGYLLTYPEEDGLLIGYVGYNGSKQNFLNFARQAIVNLVAKYSSVQLEADDCDSCAMLVSRLFQHKDPISWDTYTKGEI